MPAKFLFMPPLRRNREADKQGHETIKVNLTSTIIPRIFLVIVSWVRETNLNADTGTVVH